LGKIVEMAEADELFTHPMHPYTQALLSAIPSAKPGTAKERILLSGDVPSPLNPPSGCRFHTRCPKAIPQCKAEAPVWKEVASGHYAACHLY
jgi:oligopeptide/dipeptide ABC transporter ATP-binding protein